MFWQRLRWRKSIQICWIALSLSGASDPADACSKGEFGGDLSFLKKHYSTPQTRLESNYYIDLWEGQDLRTIARMNGLTNNHTLFINCHGMRTDARRYALYPHQSLLDKDAEAPRFAIRDLARVMGNSATAKVHNVVLSACNAEGALDVAEIRKAFPNATNIVHCAAGELGYQAMFIQAMVNHSRNVKPVYEWAERNSRGEIEYYTGPAPYRNAKRFAPYVAELFAPGVSKPFAIQRAGRELLDPHRFEDLASKR